MTFRVSSLIVFSSVLTVERKRERESTFMYTQAAEVPMLHRRIWDDKSSDLCPHTCIELFSSGQCNTWYNKRYTKQHQTSLLVTSEIVLHRILIV